MGTQAAVRLVFSAGVACRARTSASSQLSSGVVQKLVALRSRSPSRWYFSAPGWWHCLARAGRKAWRDRQHPALFATALSSLRPAGSPERVAQLGVSTH